MYIMALTKKKIPAIITIPVKVITKARGSSGGVWYRGEFHTPLSGIKLEARQNIKSGVKIKNKFFYTFEKYKKRN